MKTLVFVFLVIGNLYLFSCVNNDTATQMPDSGYKERTDSVTAAGDSLSVPKDRGAVAVDTIKNGQVTVSGASAGTPDSTKK